MALLALNSFDKITPTEFNTLIKIREGWVNPKYWLDNKEMRDLAQSEAHNFSQFLEEIILNNAIGKKNAACIEKISGVMMIPTTKEGKISKIKGLESDLVYSQQMMNEQDSINSSEIGDLEDIFFSFQSVQKLKNKNLDGKDEDFLTRLNELEKKINELESRLPKEDK